MTPRRWVSAMAAAALTLLAGCTAASEGPSTAPSDLPRHYLSLGDSLAVGARPDGTGGLVETDEGYPDVLARTLRERLPSLEHERLGCSGEDSASFLGGGAPGCDHPAGSQLAAAEGFLREHRDRTTLVTIDIGANDVMRCASLTEGLSSARIDETCVREGLSAVERNVPQIAERLRAAAGEDVPIVGMTYYNPFLAVLLLDGAGTAAPPLAEGRAPGELARYSADVVAELNATLTDAYASAGIEVADVAAAFDSDDFQVPADSETGLPANAQLICDTTWMCDIGVGPDIHPRPSGAERIAQTFADTLEGT